MKKNNYFLKFIVLLYKLGTTFLAFIYLYGVFTHEIKTTLRSLLPYFMVLVVISILKVLKDKEKDSTV